MTAPAAEAHRPASAAPDVDAGREGGHAPAHRSLPHVDALDGLRGVAVAAVLAHHAGHLTGGYLGVDLFFVLSGYLITALLLSAWRSDGRVGLRTFWARRARRLGPALVLTLLGLGLYGALWARDYETYNLRYDGLAALFEVANWRTILVGGDYFAQNPLLPQPLGHTWSLSIEEQLYLVWPLVVAGLLAWRGRARAVLVAALAGAVGSAALMVGGQALGWERSRLYLGTDTRAAAVLLGAALAALRVVLGPGRWAATRAVRQGVGLVAAAGLAVAWARLDGTSDLPYQGLLPLASLGGVAVVAAVADRRHPGPLGTVLGWAPLRWLGRISYGVYLYHYPLFQILTPTNAHVSGNALLAVKVGATLGLAELSSRFVEQPIRRGRLLTGRQARAALPAAAALAALALFAGTLGAVRPLSFDEVEYVAYSSVPNAPLVMLAGDSVPLILGYTMNEQVDELGVSVADRGLPGCHLLASLGPIRGVEGRVREDVSDCSAAGQYRRNVERLHPDVTMVLFGEFPNEAVRLDGDWVMPCQPRYLAALRGRLDALVDDLRSGGGTVVLITAPGSDISWILDRVPPGMAERVDCTNQVLEDLAAARPGVGVVDLASYVCPPGQRCLEDIDGVDLRPDGLHFDGEGARFINRWLVPQVLLATQGT